MAAHSCSCKQSMLPFPPFSPVLMVSSPDLVNKLSENFEFCDQFVLALQSSWEDQETNRIYSCVDLYLVSQVKLSVLFISFGFSWFNYIIRADKNRWTIICF